VAVLAVLDAAVLEQLDCLVSGRAPGRNAERLLNFRLPAAGGGGTWPGGVPVTVCWHDAADFATQLLKANPSCLEALASEEPPLHAGEEWAALRASFGRGACAALLGGKTYRNACAGAALRLVRRQRERQAQGLGAAQEEAGEEEEAAGAELLAGRQLRAVAELCSRACAGGLDAALLARVEAMAARAEPRKAEWREAASDAMRLTKGLPHAAGELPAGAVEAWLEGVRRDDFRAFAAACLDAAPAAPLAPPAGQDLAALAPGWSERLAGAWPRGAELAFMAQTGSFMYNLQLPSSDCDFSIVFLADPEALAGRAPPAAEFHHHVEASFAADKRGEVEYSGKELGPFLLELAKGNPRNVELLFTERPHVAGPPWRELRARRRSFLTLRCARQYLGFVADRLRRAELELESLGAAAAWAEQAGKKCSKWLYHAHHRLFELRRVLSGAEPVVALEGQERELVMGLRLRPPASPAEARAQLAEAEARLQDVGRQLETATAEGRLPEEVDAGALAAWLRSTRAWQASRAAVGMETATLSPGLAMGQG